VISKAYYFLNSLLNVKVMIKIYVSSYKNKLNDLDFFRYLNQFPLEVKEKILRFRKWEDRQASLYGKLLLKKALKDLGIESGLTNLKYSEYGRPYLENNTDFNISHSGYVVVCAISTDGKIGIDIEEIKPTSIFDFKKQFSDEEWKIIVTSGNAYFWFYYYWTAKEAVIKADGKGLSVPLENIIIIDDKTQLGQTLWFIKSIILYDNYILHVASDKVIKQKPGLLEILF
jgi:4'-phosphopantetheinyl transferase